MSELADERPAKRRKKEKNPNLVRVGDKLIDLGLSWFSDKGKEGKPQRKDAQSQQPPEQGPLVQKAKETKSARDSNLDRDRPRKQQHRNQDHDPPLLKPRKALPIWAHQGEIKAALRGSNDVLLIVGETGSGKSTQVPQFLCSERWCRRKKVKIDSMPDLVNVGGMIAVTEPRRVAAMTLASRVAREMGTPLKTGPQEGSVGYSVRFDHKVPKGTKIKFLTEGMLLQELLRDPNLRQYSAVIVDEIHERSVDVDLISGFLKQIVTGDRSGRGGVPLKVVIMSATADVEQIQDFFSSTTSDAKASPTSVQLLRIKGRQYPVEIKHTTAPVSDIREAMFQQISKIHEEEPLPGDVLAFFTGQEDIEAMQHRLEEYSSTLASDVPKILVCPLFGQLSIQAQQTAFQPAPHKFTRKIILATNIAETSVTVPGVRYVVDCGKAKVKQFRPQLGMESLLAKPISKSSAQQRAGRAGREGPGKCFRLYAQEAYNELKDSDLPEILRNDVLGAILTMKARGINDVFAFPLMDFPDIDSVQKALFQLQFLDAIAEDGTITDIGRKLALFPVSAPYGRVLLAAAEPQYDCLLEAIDVISCVTAGENIFHQLYAESFKNETTEAEQDQMEEQEKIEEVRKELYRREGDILTYLTTMQKYTEENADRIQWCRQRRINIRNMRQALNIRNQLRALCLKEKMLHEKPPADPQPFVPMSPERAEALLKCFLKGFVIKCALLAQDGNYVTTEGKHAVAIHPASALNGRKVEAIMFLEHVFTKKNYAKKVSAIQADWIVEELRRV